MGLRGEEIQGSASSHLQNLKIANARGPFPVVRAFEISQKPQGFFEMLMFRAGLHSAQFPLLSPQNSLVHRAGLSVGL